MGVRRPLGRPVWAKGNTSDTEIVVLKNKPRGLEKHERARAPGAVSLLSTRV